MIQGFSSGLLGNRELIYETDLPSFQRDFASLKTLNHGYGPNIDTSSFRGSTATYFDVNGVLQTAAIHEPRFDHSGGSSLGLLIEESRTNSIRNSQAGGAVVGSPGTLPTNWSVVGGGISSEVIGTGTASGLSYVDIKISGTTTGTSSAVYYEAQNNIVAASGQTWTASHYVAVVGGSASNINLFRTLVRGNLSTSTLVENISTNFTPTSALTRYSGVGTLADPTSVRVNGGLFLSHSSGVNIDITFRIAAPQLEQGAFPTSYIPTTNAAATRAADLVSLTSIGSFYNQTEGSVFGESTAFSANNSRIISFSDNTTSNRMIVSRGTGSGGNINASVTTGGVSQFSGTILASSLAADTTNRFCFAYRSNDFAGSANGLTPVTNTSASVPSVSQLTIGSGESVGSNAYSGYVRKIAYWPKRLSNTLLQQLTT